MYWPLPPSNYQQQTKSFLLGVLPDHDHVDAPMAVRHVNLERGTLAPGVFSTSDLLTEGRISSDPDKLGKCTINLNHAVTRLLTDASGKVTAVETYDLLAGKTRSYKAKFVVLAAGTVESAKLAQMSHLNDPGGVVGKGITDHPVLFTHFSIPVGNPRHRIDRSSKTLSRHKNASSTEHPYNMLLELGADLNQGRYLDPDTLKRHVATKGNAMLCEIVFLFNSPLIEDNFLQQDGPSYVKPIVKMAGSPSADAFFGEVNAIKDQVISALGGEGIDGDGLALKTGGLGGVAHEVGTLRMGAPGQGFVNSNLQAQGHSNLYVCDLSVFPTSPAANPSLTLVALALRLATHIHTQL